MNGKIVNGLHQIKVIFLLLKLHPGRGGKYKEACIGHIYVSMPKVEMLGFNSLRCVWVCSLVSLFKIERL